MKAAVRNTVLAALALAAMAAIACGASEDGERSDSAQAPTAQVRSTPTSVPVDAPLHAQIEVAPDFTLPSANGSNVTLSELSSEQPVVLVFYRAFW